ncbi:MAG TPA: fused MFS/spermidine synthase [Verrucomicrobiae bacterium]|nr:fused MFS/spermidine synthase [Verrucomicrobiae bacterium]
MRRAPLLILFFFTGATALGYQLVWTRLLSNVLGHEMRAVIAVVSGFMAGMALGSWLLGEVIRRSPHPGRWYGGLEVFIGVWAAFVVPRYPLLLVPAVVAMGASFPAMARFIQGRNIAALYAANTLGAVVGILAVTWWLVPAAGLRASGLVLGAVNVTIGFTAWFLNRPVPFLSADISEVHPRWLITIWLTGFLAIGFEILGIHVLSQVMENTVYSFAATLAVYLLGTSLGAAWYQRYGAERWLNDLLGSTAIVCLGSIMMMSKAQIIYSGLRNAFGDSDVGVLMAELILAATVFLLPTFLMGAIFSLLMQQHENSVSKMLAANTFGSALAPFVLGFGLLPVIGSKWALVLLSVAYFAVMTRSRWAMPVVAGVMVALVPNVRLLQVPPGGTVVAYREGILGSVAVLRDAAGDRTLKVNNRFQMGGTAAAETEYRQARLPLKILANPRRALFLGVGTGITFSWTTMVPDLTADGVELIPEVHDLMSCFAPQNYYDQAQGRLRVHVADARRFIARTRRDYDVIVADLFHPARDGAGTLYTREHFTAIRERLARGGLFCQWLPMHQMDEQMLRVVTRTFLEVFPNTRAYLLHWSVDVPVLALIGTDSWPSNADQIANDPKVSGGFVAGPEALCKFAGNAPINTDDHQIITYAAPRFTYQRHANSYDRLMTIVEIEPPPTDFLKARNVYLHGLVHEIEGRLDEAIDAYIRSARISDQFTMGYSRCISLAAVRAKDRPAAARALLERLIEAKPNEKLARDLLERLFPTREN